MLNQKTRSKFIILLSCLIGMFSHNPTLAQLTTDQTLGSENSIVTKDVEVKGALADVIEGGAIRNSNLFHSFSEFNINELQRVYFANPSGIENIFTRVTGANSSHIFGTLGVNGNANLYLLNPHGFVFGENAQLDITGSFTATTADSIIFNNFNFSAINPEAPPLLNITVPLGLQYGNSQNAGIINTGNLKVGTESNLSLFAGTVINTGQLLAPEGQVIIATFPNLNSNNNSLSELINNADSEHNLGLTINSNGEVVLDDYIVENGDIIIKGETGKASIETGTATLLSTNNITLLESELLTRGDLNLLAFDTVKIRDSVTNLIKIEAGGNLSIQGNQGIDILALNHPHTPFQSGGNLSLVSDGIISGDAHFSSRGNFSILNLSGEAGEFVSLYDPIISSEKDVIIGGYTGTSLKIESMGSITTGNIIISGADTTLTPNNDPDVDILRSSPSLILRAGLAQLEHTPSIFPFIISNPIYYNNFEGNIGNEWSNRSTDVTPIGDRQFLGKFGSQVVSLNLDNLPFHQEATVSFDLFLIESWDGNDPATGVNDIWSLGLDSGLSLLNATFSNYDSSYGIKAKPQSYPNSYNPSNLINNPGRTGASENNTLGYTRNNLIIDSVYQLSFTFPHSDNNLGLNFAASQIDDESWGLDNVAVIVQDIINSTGQISPGTITTGNISTLGGPVILSGTSDININGSIISRGGDITLNSGGIINTTASEINSKLNDINGGGAITLIATGDIFTGNIKSQGGDIIINSGGEINTIAGEIRSFSEQNGGDISLIAQDNISIGYITSSGDTGGGNISIKTEGNFSIDGLYILRSDAFRSGKGGTIELNANSVLLQHGGRILTGSERGGTGGDVNITTNLLELSGVSIVEKGFYPLFPNTSVIPTLISTATATDDDAGNITINTDRLVVKDGALGITSLTVGSGRGGDLIINASESIELIGGDDQDQVLTALSSDTADIDSRFGNNYPTDGNAGDIFINTPKLTALNGAVISSSSFNSGQGGNITINASESINLAGVSIDGFASGFYSQAFGAGEAGKIQADTSQLTIQDNATITARSATVKEVNFPSNYLEQALRVIFSDVATGNAGDIEINSDKLTILSGGNISASTSGSGNAGSINLQPLQNGQNLNINFSQGSEISASTSDQGNGGSIILSTPSAIALLGQGILKVETTGLGNAGNINFSTQNLTIAEGVTVSASTSSNGNGGSLLIDASGSFTLNQSELLTDTKGLGNGGSILVNTSQFAMENSTISALSQGQGNSGNINLNVLGELSATNSNIQTSALQSSGGTINITASDIRLWGNSDITTNVFNGAGGGGDIIFTANSILAFGDSDILAFARDGKGGNIIFNSPIFFGFGYYPAPFGTDPTTLNGNNRVDINASGAINGLIILPDVSFIENSLTELPNNLIDPDSLLANSCIVQTESGSKFIVTGSGGLPQRPTDASVTYFSTGEIQPLTNETSTHSNNNWQKGDPIIEATGVYQLANGDLFISHECSD